MTIIIDSSAIWTLLKIETTLLTVGIIAILISNWLDNRE